MKTILGGLAVSMLVLGGCFLDDSDSAAKSGTQAGSAGAADENANKTAPPSSSPSTVAPPNAPPASNPAPVAVSGGVFTISNDVADNAVVAFERDAANGNLSAAGTYSTGGKGTGAGLGSQGALTISPNGKFLIVVDAGSNEITSFAILANAKLEKRSHVSSNGTMPISVAVRDDLVYALNAGGTTNCISGFKLDAMGVLTPIDGSKHSLSAAQVGPAQISFSPKGDALVVTEKMTNIIDTYGVLPDGKVTNGYAVPSVGQTPFGFAFAPAGQLIVTEAFAAAVGLSAGSSYALGPKGSAGDPTLVPISRSIATRQTAACWIAVTGDGKWAFTTNTPSDNISTFAINGDGSLALRGNGATASTGEGSRPIDLAMDRGSKYLYTLNGGTNDISAFTIAADGSLSATARAAVKIPDQAVGIAAQ